ncbi:HAMP domain-containing protein [Nocardia otitidiscaviarum]|uniref:histidine kinase n=2 Tax=Nocardia TaxID=1817 RepID=A0A516NSS4_9NOCA|nr:ATP-binding protein [Nocardia otitidiscaviarum]QDP81947.1 HAMP domain-containing protein [Nocardia otitidiscaviarum]
MRDAASSGSKRWALSNWDLRWKVTAVLAVPLLVAVVLGASRISAEFRESTRLSTAVEHVSVIPAITGLSATASQVAGGQMVKIGGNSFTTDPELAQLDTAIQFAEKAAPKLSDMPNARAALDDMIVAAKAIRAQGLAPSESVPDTVAQIERVRGSSVNTVESIVATVADKSVDQAKLQLVDSLNSRAVLVGEVAGFAEALRNNPKDGVRDIQIGISTERQLLAVLAHRFPDGDPLISELQNQVNIRLQLVGSPEASVGQLPVTELKDSLVVSVDKYQTIATDSTKAIVSRVDALAATARTDAIRYAVIVVATILGALALAVLMARSMIVPLRRLRLAALRVAEHDLAHEVSALRDGADPEDVPLEPMPVDTDEEIGQLARAVDDIHGQALRLAADQAAMRTQVNDMFETLARRSKSLVDHQLTLIEAMEYDEKDPRLLENLFRLDHLAARMRRNGDNLLILAGTKQRRSKSAPVEIADVLRAAISEVEDYERVKLGATPRGALVEPAASDLAHLFAELLDNALRASPPETDVKFTFAQAHDTGLLIEVADRGIGMPPAEMAEINRRLETTAEVGPDTARHMGLFVVGRLAERHGLTVRLRPTFDTARDPGVTVTVHVPKALIMAPGGAISVPPQPGGQQQPAPQPGGPQPSAPSSMQMRAVTRTATGNVMVTVDPGGSGAIPAAPGSGAGAPAPAAANASGGLPQRSPGSAGAAVGLPQRAPGGAAPAGPGGLPQRQPGTSGPTVRHTVAAPPGPGGLPQREPGANNPVPPSGQPNTNLQPRQPGDGPARPGGGLAANMMRRQGGAPGAPGGLPQRPGPGAPPPGGPGGLPPRDASGALPQRESGLAPREGGAPAGPGGLPQRQPGTNGAPPRDPSAGGLPQRAASGGLPQRDPGANGAPPREGGKGLPQRGDAPGGLPQRGEAPGGLPQRGEAPGGLPQRGEAPGGLPQRGEAPGGLPQRGEAPGGLPQRGEAPGGLPQRGDAPGGLPQRAPGSNGAPPQRDSALGGLPQRDSGLPKRDNGLPQRDSAMPRRDAASTGLTQRDTVLPQRESALPQRDNTLLPQRDGGLPQRQPGTAPGGMPQRPSPSGLPQRDPGAGLPQRPAPVPGLRGPAAGGATEEAPAGPGKHSFRSNPQKTASFFQTRLQPASEDDSSFGTPIFAEMMSAWLQDPNADRSQVAASFESPGDEGWQAARRAVESQPEKRTAAGLPQRDPGHRLVPGGVNGNAERTTRRDPESIRSSLSRHQQGVRDGRAQQAMNLTGDKGDR